MLDNLIDKLQTHSGIESKKDIQSAAKTFSHSPFTELGKSAMLGDDAAVIPTLSRVQCRKDRNIFLILGPIISY